MSRYRNTMSELLKQVRGIKEQDDKDHDVSMARGELEAIADKATQLASMLQGKSDDGNPLEAWVQSKITKAKDYINSVSDYLMYNPDMKQNESHGPKIFTSDKGSIEKVGDKFHTYKGDKKSVHDTLDDAKSALNEDKGYTDKQIKMAYGILNDPRYKGGNYDGAVKAIEKISKGLSNHPDVANALKRANEEVDLDEGRMKDIYQMQQDGKSAEEIAKYLKLSVQTVKGILGEEKLEEAKGEYYQDTIKKMRKQGKSIDQIATALKMNPDIIKIILDEEALDEKVADSIIKDLQKAYGDLKGKTISPEMANKLSKHLDQPSYDLDTLRQLYKANIPFVSTLARNKIYKKTGKFEEVELEEVKTPSVEPDKRSDGEKDIDKIKLAKEKDTDAIEKQLIAAQGQINILKQKLENEKNRAVKPEPNPETGEVPLTIGIANKLLKDKAEKDAKKKEEMKEEMRLYVESIAAVKNKAEKTGMPYSILKQVYDRGMAAWKGGHRPGAGQVQWALARVNSFVTKSSGTWGGADKDLAAKVKGSK